MRFKLYFVTIGIIASSVIAKYYDKDYYGDDDDDDDKTCEEQPDIKPNWEFNKYDKNQDGMFFFYMTMSIQYSSFFQLY